MDTDTLAPPPAAPTAEPSFDVSSLFGGGPPTPAAAPEPATPPPDATPAPVPDAGTMLEQMLGQQQPPAAPAAPVPDPANSAAPATPATPVPAPAAKGFDMDAWLKEKFPENPEGIAKIEDWKTARAVQAKALASLAEAHEELNALKAKIPAKGSEPLPETEAVKKLSLEMATLQQKYDSELSEFQKLKAAGELESNHAFRQEHDGQRVALFDSAKEVADEAGIPEEKLKAVFDAPTEYAMAKALGDIEDPTAAALLREKANAFRGLTKAKETALKNPTSELQKWRDYEAGMPGVLSGKITEGLRQRFAADAVSIRKELTDPEKGDVFFKTPAGKAVLDSIQSRFDQGFDVTPAEHVKHMALAAAMPVYQQVATRQAQAIVELQQRLSRYENADPNQGGAPPPGGGGKGGGFDVGSMFPQR